MTSAGRAAAIGADEPQVELPGRDRAHEDDPRRWSRRPARHPSAPAPAPWRTAPCRRRSVPGPRDRRELGHPLGQGWRTRQHEVGSRREAHFGPGEARRRRSRPEPRCRPHSDRRRRRAQGLLSNASACGTYAQRMGRRMPKPTRGRAHLAAQHEPVEHPDRAVRMQRQDERREHGDAIPPARNWPGRCAGAGPAGTGRGRIRVVAGAGRATRRTAPGCPPRPAGTSGALVRPHLRIPIVKADADDWRSCSSGPRRSSGAGLVGAARVEAASSAWQDTGDRRSLGRSRGRRTVVRLPPGAARSAPKC